MCLNNTNLLLRGNDSSSLKATLCNLNDNQLKSLFVLISSKLDYTKVKKKVFDNTLLSNTTFYSQAYDAVVALNSLQNVILNLK